MEKTVGWREVLGVDKGGLEILRGRERSGGTAGREGGEHGGKLFVLAEVEHF